MRVLLAVKPRLTRLIGLIDHHRAVGFDVDVLCARDELTCSTVEYRGDLAVILNRNSRIRLNHTAQHCRAYSAVDLRGCLLLRVGARTQGLDVAIRRSIEHSVD